MPLEISVNLETASGVESISPMYGYMELYLNNYNRMNVKCDYIQVLGEALILNPGSFRFWNGSEWITLPERQEFELSSIDLNAGSLISIAELKFQELLETLLGAGTVTVINYP